MCELCRNMLSPSLVLIPTYNEAPNLASLISAIRQIDDSDILIIDDNSPDGTGRIADKLAQRGPQVKILHRASKQGLGTAHTIGIEHAKQNGYRSILTMDADFTHAPSDIPRLRRALVDQQADIVIGSRHLQPDGILSWSMSRRAITKVANGLTAIMLGLRCDCTNSFRIYRLSSLDLPAIKRLGADGYSFMFEVIFLCHTQGLRIVEIPVQLNVRRAGRSKISVMEVVKGLRSLCTLSGRRLRMRLGRGPTSGPKELKGGLRRLSPIGYTPPNTPQRGPQGPSAIGAAAHLFATVRNVVDMAKYVISGVSQGIGRFLHEQLGGIGLTRQNAPQLLSELRANGDVDAVIHCAFNSMKAVSSEIVHAYYCDNILLTKQMLSIPHRKFCFFSSVDVYEKDQRIKTEDQVIHIERGIDPYAFTKLMSKSLVLAKSHEPLILRPTQMLGSNRRPNVLTRTHARGPWPPPAYGGQRTELRLVRGRPRVRPDGANNGSNWGLQSCFIGQYHALSGRFTFR